MKKLAVLVSVLLLLTGCSQSPDEVETGMELRSKLLQAPGCTFQAEITADYGDRLQSFSMDCRADASGDVAFSVRKPDTISGITGKLSGEGGALTFDALALHFDLMAEEQLSPVSAPWILMKTLRSGYITSGCREEGRIRLSIDDSFRENALRLDIWLDRQNLPQQADILYDGRRILSVAVADFEIL